MSVFVRVCASAPLSEKEISDNLAVRSLIRAYQVRWVSIAFLVDSVHTQAAMPLVCGLRLVSSLH